MLWPSEEFAASAELSPSRSCAALDDTALPMLNVAVMQPCEAG